MTLSLMRMPEKAPRRRWEMVLAGEAQLKLAAKISEESQVSTILPPRTPSGRLPHHWQSRFGGDEAQLEIIRGRFLY